MTKKKGIIGTIKEGFAESTRNVHTINKEHLAAVKADSKALFEEAKTPDPGLVKVKQAKGLGNKIKVIGQNIKDGAAANSEREKERLTEIMSFDSYRTLLEGQRTMQQTMIKRKY
jgi:hypothetical protein